MMGLGQAVCILVGQRLGADRPDLAEKSDLHRAEVGVRLHVPGRRRLPARSRALVVSVFEGDRDPEDVRGGGGDRAGPAGVRGGLLAGGRGERDVRVRPARGRRHAVRLAADVRLAWPIMVVPTYWWSGWAAASTGRGWFATAHIFAMAVLLLPAVPHREVEDDARDRAGRCGGREEELTQRRGVMADRVRTAVHRAVEWRQMVAQIGRSGAAFCGF